MKKTTDKRRLLLSQEKVRDLQEAHLPSIQGGYPPGCGQCTKSGGVPPSSDDG